MEREITTPALFVHTPEHARYEEIAAALNNLTSLTTDYVQASICNFLIHPTTRNWRACRLYRATQTQTLWWLMMEVCKPTPEDSIKTPSPSQVIRALRLAGQYR